MSSWFKPPNNELTVQLYDVERGTNSDWSIPNLQIFAQIFIMISFSTGKLRKKHPGVDQ